MNRKLGWTVVAGCAFACVAGTAVWMIQPGTPLESAAGASQALPQQADAADDICPAGYRRIDPVALSTELNAPFAASHAGEIRAKYGHEVCAPKRLKKANMAAKALGEADWLAAHGTLGPQGLSRAVAQKAALAVTQAKVANAVGRWEAYGQGPQVADDVFPSGANDGITTVAGRADDFAWDAEHQRLFVAIGNGGIWMSQAVDGDLATLGEQWTSIGDRLPIQVTSAVGWTPADGGRVIALTGEHVQGGNSYVGLGAYWSDDLGKTWQRAEGIPDGLGASRIAVDPSRPEIIYAATSMGLFRSEDAGSSFVNVALPVSEDCAGVVGPGPCQFASVVSDVVVRAPGGVDDVQCAAEGCSVLAAVGYRSGAAPYPDGRPQAPGNGLYRSETGVAGSFARVGDTIGQLQTVTGGLLPIGFAPQPRIGRIELGAANGPAQDHDYVYAIVQDAVLFNGGLPLLDLPTDLGIGDIAALCNLTTIIDPTVAELCALVLNTVAGGATTLNGIYVSSDFGDTWLRMGDDVELTYLALPTGSSLALTVALGVGPGIQSWYNLWVQPDPTQATAQGVPTRLLFGMEELWKNRLPLPLNGLPQQTPLDFKVFGTYFAGNTCLFLIGNLGLGEGLPICPFRDGLLTDITTTHPDQHAGIFIPDPQRGGVWLFAGNDGGVYKQYSADPASDDFDNTKWGDGANQGFYTLMNYGIGVSADGTVYYGLQDNASGKIEPDTRRQVRLWIGDGIWAAVHPEHSDIAYYQTPGLALVRTTDGGQTTTSIGSFDVGSAHFFSPFRMDTENGDHLVAAGTRVAETLDASADATWTTVFDLGANPESGRLYQSRGALDVQGDAVYVAACAPCNVLGLNENFSGIIATNVGGELPPQAGTADGWHVAAAQGLPNRYVYDIEIDADDPRTVYVVLGGYSSARWASVGQYLDSNPNVGEGFVYKSTDGGATFTDISGDLPEVVSTAIVRRGNQLVVGTDIGVFISSDLNGSQWVPLGDLPAVAINDLVLRPGDDSELFAATFGRGVQRYEFDKALDGEGGLPGGEVDDDRFGGALPASWLLWLVGLLALRTLAERARRASSAFRPLSGP